MVRSIAVLGSLLLALFVATASVVPDPDTDGGTASTGTTLRLKNEYAESIFNVTYSVDGQAETTWLSGTRLDMFDTQTKSIDHEKGALISITFDVTSVGQTHNFTFTDVELKGGTLEFVYDLDSATTEFRIEYSYQ